MLQNKSWSIFNTKVSKDERELKVGVTANKLLIDLRDFAALVREREDYVSSEIETRTSLINPFLETLGWDVRNPKVCRQEFRSDLSGHRMVDYALFDKEGNLVIIVEAKTKNVKLEDKKIFAQLNGYFAHSTASFGIITNGCIYLWYTRDGDTGFLKTTPSLVFDVREPNSHDAEFLQAFVGTSFERDAAKKIAIEVELQSRLISWFKNASNEPTEKFTRWLIKEAREKYPTLTLPSTLSQSRIAKYQQIVKSALNKFVYERHLTLTNHDKLESEEETGLESERHQILIVPRRRSFKIAKWKHVKWKAVRFSKARDLHVHTGFGHHTLSSVQMANVR